MAQKYVRSTDGSDSDNGSTWALAKATTNGATTIAAAGDTVNLSQSHAESAASAINISWTSSTAAAPVAVVCVNDGAEPPTAEASTASLTTTGNNSIQLNGPSGGHAYYKGLTLNAGNSTGTANITVGNGGGAGHNRVENCNLNLLGTGASSRINLGLAANTARGELLTCVYRFSSTSQQFLVSGSWRIHGGSFDASTASPSSALFAGNSNCVNLEVIGLDLSNLSSSVTLFNPGSAGPTGVARFIGCTLPPSWSGSLIGVSPVASLSVVELINCDSGATNYRYWRETEQGSVKHSTSIYRDNGVTVDATHLGWTLASNANCKFPVNGLQSEDLFPVYVGTTGTSVTASVEIATNNVTLKDDEFVLELFYPSSTATPIHSRVSSEKASFVASGSNLTTSSETWTGVPGTPVKQTVSVTFTPQMKGYLLARVTLYKPSTTVYVDPMVTLA